MNFIKRPSIDLYPGVIINKDSVLEFKNDHVSQKIENLVLYSITKLSGDGYESTVTATIQLQDGDILIFEDEGRGYIKPVEGFATIEEAIEDLQNIKDLG